MRRFIRYLYEYEQEKKMRNVGFVKIEQDMEQCVIHVHGKGFRMEEDAKGLEVYLFWNQDEKCTGINMGVTEPPSPGLNYQLCYTPEDMGGERKLWSGQRNYFERHKRALLCCSVE